MKASGSIFIRATRKLFRIIFYKLECTYYHVFYSRQELKTDLTQKQYLVGGGGKSDDISSFYRELFPDRIEAKISEAELICQHVFELLGSGPKYLGQEGNGYQPIDWHSDFKSGYRWNPKTFYGNIRFGNTEGVDVKVPWELSRFQHLNVLGQAYVLTNDRKYAEEFSSQISDWIKHNPVAFGVNWKCTMEVAIRAANWLVAMEYFADKDLLSQEFLKEFYGSVYEHGKFIRSHLEYSSKSATNHYIANIAGLFFISVYCPFFKESGQWQKFAIREFSEEIEEQIHPDGCDIEASTSYHRLVLEMFFYCELLCKRAGVKFSIEYQAKLKKMFEFSLYCIKPNGSIPQIGDNDSGRFLVFTKRPILEHKYFLTLASLYYKDSFFKLPNFSFDEEAFWLFGKRAKEFYDQLPLRTDPLGSKSFPDAGWFIIRHDNDYCFISCGSNSRNRSRGHVHNDSLSFELMLNRQDIIVDPGTYVYTPCPKERNTFRSTEYHNTIKFNGYEQNEVPKKDIFGLLQEVRVKEVSLMETDNDIVFQGEIQYSGLTHILRITFDKESSNYQIQDSISCSKPLNGKLIFHLSPNSTSDGKDVLIKESKVKIASIEVKGSKLEKGKYDYSPEYGVKVKADCLIVNTSEIQKTRTISTYIRKHKRNTN